jgi:hypothetical protein
LEAHLLLLALPQRAVALAVAQHLTVVLARAVVMWANLVQPCLAKETVAVKEAALFLATTQCPAAVAVQVRLVRHLQTFKPVMGVQVYNLLLLA